MLDTGHLHRVVDVVHDLLPAHFRERTAHHRARVRRSLSRIAQASLPQVFNSSANIFARPARLLAGDAVLLAQESDREIDHDDAAVPRQRAQHVVGHVARMVRERAAGRVRGDDRRPRDLEGVVERLVGDVRDIDHHAEPIQLADHVPAERRQAVVSSAYRPRSRPSWCSPSGSASDTGRRGSRSCAAGPGRRRSCGRLPCP